ncbi:MAG: TatD family hydrolase [Elusimicrobiaceae bacterium]|nr:TatD family hydrolase [Elusimicrobiaceae bacterium]
MNFIDSHAHLTDPAFDMDRDVLITQILPNAHIIKSIEIGCAPDEWQAALDLTQKYPGMIAPVLGVHPEYAAKFTSEQTVPYQQFLKDPRVVAVGEIGLDYTCLEMANKDMQYQLFSQMIEFADKASLPLVLHVRRQAEDYSAYTETFHLLQTQWKQHATRSYSGVLHCFCARYEEAKKALDMGLLLGINGCFTYKKNEYIREAIKKVGPDKIILETDCPYLSPQGKRGTRNDPSNIPLIAQYVADYLNISTEELARKTVTQTKLLYGLP